MLLDLRRNPVIGVGKKLAELANESRELQRLTLKRASAATLNAVRLAIKVIVNFYAHASLQIFRGERIAGIDSTGRR